MDSDHKQVASVSFLGDLDVVFSCSSKERGRILFFRSRVTETGLGGSFVSVDLPLSQLVGSEGPGTGG